MFLLAFLFIVFFFFFARKKRENQNFFFEKKSKVRTFFMRNRPAIEAKNETNSKKETINLEPEGRTPSAL